MSAKWRRCGGPLGAVSEWRDGLRGFIKLHAREPQQEAREATKGCHGNNR